MLSRVFRYAIATARAERDPASDLRGALTVPMAKHLAAITTSKGAGALMRAIDGYTGHAVTLFALKLSAHLFVRPGELRQAEWAEFDFERRIWDIPAEKMKMRRPHRVPLSTQAVDLFEELYELTGTGKFCFPSFRTPKRPMSENTVNAALRALGFGPAEMTAHGFRAMAATLLNEDGSFNPDAIERQLAHVESNGVRRAYPALPNQLHRLELKLAAELPSLHSHPPVSKTPYLGVHETGSSSEILWRIVEGRRSIRVMTVLRRLC